MQISAKSLLSSLKQDAQIQINLLKDKQVNFCQQWLVLPWNFLLKAISYTLNYWSIAFSLLLAKKTLSFELEAVGFVPNMCLFSDYFVGNNCLLDKSRENDAIKWKKKKKLQKESLGQRNTWEILHWHTVSNLLLLMAHMCRHDLVICLIKSALGAASVCPGSAVPLLPKPNVLKGWVLGLTSRSDLSDFRTVSLMDRQLLSTSRHS